MRPKAIPHPTVEGKFTCSCCGHGKDGGRARQVINKYIRRHCRPTWEAKGSEESSEKAARKPASEPEDDIPIKSDEPEWLKFDAGEEVDVKPSRLKGVSGRFIRALNESGSGTKAPLPRESQEAVAAFCWRGVDRLYTKWGQAMKQDPEYKVEHSDEEIEIIAVATVNSMEHHDIDVSKFLHPDITLAALVGLYYGPPTVEITMSKSKKVKSFMVRIPIIGRFFRKKEKKVTQVEEEVET